MDELTAVIAGNKVHSPKPRKKSRSVTLGQIHQKTQM